MRQMTVYILIVLAVSAYIVGTAVTAGIVGGIVPGHAALLDAAIIFLWPVAAVIFLMVCFYRISYGIGEIVADAWKYNMRGW